MRFLWYLSLSLSKHKICQNASTIAVTVNYLFLERKRKLFLITDHYKRSAYA